MSHFSLDWQRALHGLELGALLLLSACGDNRSPAQDAGPEPIVDSGLVDARPDARRDDANTTDASPAPDAIPASSCSAALELVPGSSHIGDTGTQNNGSSASCSAGSLTAPDAVYRVPLPATPTDLIARVIVDENADLPYDAVLSVQSVCGDGDSERACSDFGLSESVEALALSDEAFVQVDGTGQFGGSPTGHYQLDVRTRSIAAQGAACDPLLQSSRCDTGLRCVASLCESDSPSLACDEALPLASATELTGRTHAFEADHFQGSCAFDANSGAPERVFAISLAQSSDLLVTTDLLGTSFDTVLYLVDTCQGTELACNDDVDAQGANFNSSLQVSALPAGDYLLILDGSSPQAATGSFTIRLDISPI